MGYIRCLIVQIELLDLDRLHYVDIIVYILHY